MILTPLLPVNRIVLRLASRPLCREHKESSLHKTMSIIQTYQLA